MINKLQALVPNYLGEINWEEIDKVILPQFKEKLINTQQEPKFHGEGNVYIHTKMVCEELIKIPEYHAISDDERFVVFMAALLHDIGKISCTKIVDGEIRSFNHGINGAIIVRKFLWNTFNMCGNETMYIREAICLLIKYHSSLLWSNDNLKKIIKISMNSKLTKFFSIKLLGLLSKADVLGRIGDSKEELTLKIMLSEDLAKQNNCYDTYFEFYNDYTKYKLLNTDESNIYSQFFDSSSNEAIIMCGLPASGKDTYILNNICNGYTVITLDEIRKELHIKPTDDQTKVMEYSKKLMKNALACKENIVWNATSLNVFFRKSQIELLKKYNYKVKIVYIETTIENIKKRNEIRDRKVPLYAVYNMFSKFSIPEEFEADEVIWLIN